MWDWTLSWPVMGSASVWTHRGVESSLPVTPLTSERVIPVPIGASLINQGSAALLRSGKPAALTYWDAGDGIPQYRLCWLENLSWRTATVSSFRNALSARRRRHPPPAHSRPELLIDPNGRALVLYRSRETNNALVALQLDPPDYDLRRARPQTLVDEDLGFYEPVVNRARVERPERACDVCAALSQGLGVMARKTSRPPLPA